MCEGRKLRVDESKTMVDDGRMNVALNGKLLEEVECFKYLGTHVAIVGGIDEGVKFGMNEVGKMCGGNEGSANPCVHSSPESNKLNPTLFFKSDKLTPKGVG